nr:hypothetical protein [Paenibacillus koleovorans]
MTSNVRLDLNADWQLTWENVSCGVSGASAVSAKMENWLHCALPVDVHMPLLEAGLIPEPLVGDQSFASEWIERRSW